MNKITYITLILLALASATTVAQSRKDSLTTKVVDVVKKSTIRFIPYTLPPLSYPIKGALLL